jgi:hypothetical protein
MPALNELEVCYYNLKPTTTNNVTGSGTNTNAVPSRGSNYTAGTPAQTAATDFKLENTEAFASISNIYWSSTESASATAWAQFLIMASNSAAAVREIATMSVPSEG